MRKTFFDVIESLDEEDMLCSEFYRIRELFSEKKIFIEDEEYTIREYIDKNFFLGWKYRKTCIDIEDMALTYDIPNDDSYEVVNLEELIIYFEYILNLILLVTSSNNYDLQHTLKLIRTNIELVLDKYNYKVFQIEKDKLIIIEKSEIVSAVSKLNEDIAPQMIEYNSISLKGNIKRKKELILLMAHKYESLEKKLKANDNGEIVKYLGVLLNNLNIRHNNMFGKNANAIVKSMTEKELEDWYDKIYDILLLALMTSHYIDFKPDIKKLNESLKKSET